MSDLGNRSVMAANLRRLMAAAGKDRNTLCKDLNLKYSTVSEWLNATAYPRIDKIELMANYFGVQKSDLVEKFSPHSAAAFDLPSNLVPLGSMKKIPLLGAIACGEPILAEQNIEDHIDLPRHIKADFALTCRGDSMVNAGIRDGDVVYILQRSEIGNGQIAAVMIGDSDATLKRFYRDGDKVILSAENAAYPPKTFIGSELEHLRIIGLAVAYTHVIEQ